MRQKESFDYLIVGAGLFGSVFAQLMLERGKSCLVLERRSHIGGNAYTENVSGINVHRYGPHIFHTNSDRVWDYVCRFARFNGYINSPLANYRGQLYNLPFNMNTFYRMWGTATPREAREIIDRQRREAGISEPGNLEEQAIFLVGRDIYEKLVKGYTEKQWGCPCSQLPAYIIRRLPVRFTYDNNYFDARHQGVPIGGYSPMIEKILSGAEVLLNTDYLADRAHWDSLASRVIYTGQIDEFFDYRLGSLQYRGLRFETELLPTDNYQGNAIVNYTDRETPYTRIIEHKHFEFGTQPVTVISREYSVPWERGREAFYPVDSPENRELYIRYKALADSQEKVLFCGRLGEYRYYDMDKIIERAMQLQEEII